MKHRNIAGLRFGKIVAIRNRSAKGSKHQTWSFKCDCGIRRNITKDAVIYGGQNTCGKCVYDKVCNFCEKPFKGIKKRNSCSEKCRARRLHLKNGGTISFFGGKKEFWNTPVGKGLKWELYASKLLGAKHLLFNKSGPDLDWNGKSVDVKSATLNKRKNKRGSPVVSTQLGYWSFNKGDVLADFYLCFALDGKRLVKTLLIPGKIFKNTTGITVGHKSKFDKYKLDRSEIMGRHSAPVVEI